MYEVKPSLVYVTDRAERDPRAVGRMAAMLPALGDPRIERITDADIPSVIAAHALGSLRERTEQIERDADPVLVLNALKLNDSAQDEENELSEILAQCPEHTPKKLVRRLLGYDSLSSPNSHIRDEELVCRNVHEFHTTDGCVHRCQYCEAAGEPIVNMALNIEEFIEKKLDPLLRANPWQKVCRYQTQAADSLCFEPEYGAIAKFAEYFAGQDDRYLLLHTKSANTDFICDLDHNGRTIVLWSLTSDTVSRVIEQRTGTTAERIEAARRCEQAGCPVRFKFKPIIPVRDWRDETREMVRHMFAATHPDVISLCTIMWMPIEELEAAIEPKLFDQQFLKAAREDAEKMAGSRAGPFPHRVRAEIYDFFIREIRRYDETVPVSLSTESFEMWAEFEDILGFGAGNYVCGCGPECTPGLKVLPHNVLRQRREA